MYIAPNTTINILRGIPLNKSYENTVYYPNASEQEKNFKTYTKFTLSQYSYQRTQIGSIRVELSYEQLYDCDYLMFQNTAFGSKWFYAFITGVTYISNDVSEIYYEIDVMQTWCYDYTFLPTFVERRHDVHDAMYGNLKAEGLDLGPYYKIISTWRSPTDKYFVCQISQLPSGYGFTIDKAKTYDHVSGWETKGVFIVGTESGGVSVNGVANGIYIVSTDSANTMDAFIKDVTEQGLQDAIITLYTAPANIGYHSLERSFFLYTSKVWAEPDGRYRPRNKKLYSYPYCKITVTNNKGMSKDYAPQAWTHKTTKESNGYAVQEFQYYIQEVGFPQPDARFVPEGYNDGNSAVDNCIHISGWATGAIAGNTYAVWWAQNKNNYIATMNAIGTNYDTNVTIAENNYSMASRSAQTGLSTSQNSFNTAITNAEISRNTALGNANRTLTTAQNVNQIKLGTDLINAGLSLNLGAAVTAPINAYTTNEQAEASFYNQQDSANASAQMAQNSAGTSYQNAQLAYSTAMKNAATSQASSNLSALTAKSNATAQLVAKKADIQNYPNTAKGNAMGDGYPFWEEKGGAESPDQLIFDSCFEIIYSSIDVQWEQIIDKYFDAYGYRQESLFNESTLNQRICRQHYTYMKTVGCAIKGNLNAADQVTIQEIYNNGICTWDKLENVGDYYIVNDPLDPLD